jgi:tripartite-type tricarboxylate transporter receptor subunit TctC
MDTRWVLSTFVALPGLAPNVPLQLPRDFTAIGFAADNPMFIVAAPSLGIIKLADVIARAKAHPGEMSCAVTGIGRLTHLTAELLQNRADIKLLTVPYTGGPAHAISDVVSGRVGLLIEGYSAIAGAVQSGSVKAIAVASEKRLTEFPEVPAVAEMFPGFVGDRLASPGGADRHSGRNIPQSERRSAQGCHGPRSQEDDRHARQLYASDVTG